LSVGVITVDITVFLFVLFVQSIHEKQLVKQDRQCAYNIARKLVRVTMVAVEK